MNLLLVVAVALVDADGRVLIAQRPEGKALAGLWEFPGGKIADGERPEDALIRELREELGIEVRIVSLVEDILHHYPDRAVRLQFFHCRWLRHEPRPVLCDSLAWITPAQLGDYAFPAADARLLDKLRLSPEFWDSPKL